MTSEMPRFGGFEMPKFDVPAVEVPAAMRELAEKSVAQAKDGYEKLKSVTEDATDMIEDTYATYTKGVVELSTKALDAAKANTVAAFDFAREIVAVKSVAELVEKQTSFARAQFETMTAQAKDFQAVAQRVANETAAPMKTASEKAMADFRKTAA